MSRLCMSVALLATLSACGGGSGSSTSGTPASPAAPTFPSAPAQTYAVTGTVRDADNLNLLADVTVRLDAATGSAQIVTRFDGSFSFSGVSGQMTLTAAAPGYESQTSVAVVTSAVSQDVRLRRVVGRAVPCGDGPDTGNRVLPVFSKPFAGEFPLTNYFDHDLPLGAGNGYQLSYCDERITGRIDGHPGYDWVMPAGTPLLAVADGEVTYAGVDPAFYCDVLRRTVSDQQFVEIRHPAASGEAFGSVFVHLSRIDVRLGQPVARGQVVGLSGNTGCSTEPHLHLHVWRFTGTNNGRPAIVDPYGWEGAVRDPWSLDPTGGASFWLWRPEEAPRLRLR